MLRRTVSTTGWGVRAAAIAGLLVLATWWTAAPARAAEPAFGTPTIETAFGQGVDVTQPVTLDDVPTRVEVLVTTSDAGGPLVIEVPTPTTTGATTLRHTVDVSADGHLLPNTPVTVRWRLTFGEDASVVGPPVEAIYADDRFGWKSVDGDVVRVHWYNGPQSFGERALEIGERAVAETSSLLGVTEDDPIDFFIYADNQAFYDALGPGTRENVGGQANAEIRTLFALIEPNAIDDPWVEIVVPHELTHLVFDTAVQNPYHFPPRWLNEGVAVYLSQGYAPDDRRTVESAADDGTLIPLDGLGGQFPTTAERFFLAYAESVSAVDYLIRTHGQDTLVDLIGSYADGRTDDEAFQAALGTDIGGFGAAWLADLDAVVPVRHGPQPAPTGPRPASWVGDPAAPGVAATAPVVASPGQGGAVPGDAAANRPSGWILLAMVLLAIAAAVVVWVVVRRRRGSAVT